jgi:hypothetical protein
MIKQSSFLSIFVLIIASCNGHDVSNDSKINIPRLRLPLKIRAEKFFQKADSNNLNIFKQNLIKDTFLFVGKIETKKFDIYLKKKHGGTGPIIYTMNKNNKGIDTLLLFEKQVYVGTDSYYLPWITINSELEITRTDTSYHFQPIISWPDGKDVSVRDTFIYIKRFQINKFGYIIKK